MYKLCMVCLILLIWVSGVNAQSKVYWTDQGVDKIQRANLDNTGLEDLVTGLPSVRHLALDIGGGKIYWCEGGAFKIQRANLDGSNVEDVISSGISLPYGIALDIGNGKIYWTDSTAKKVQRADLNGTNIETL